MELFYAQHILSKDETITFSPQESRHLIRVLRKKIGDLIRVTNGKGLEWKGEIIDINSRKVVAEKSEFTLHKNKRPTLHLSLIHI